MKLPLGKKVSYIASYDNSLLYPIPRTLSREKVGIPTPHPFSGVDIWNAYEFSWLNEKGKPQIAIIRFYFPASSINIVESKSLKLYLYSFSQTRMTNPAEVIKNDLCNIIGAEVKVELLNKNDIAQLPGICLDDLDIEISEYILNPQLLKTSSERAEETLFTHLLKSNCPETGQPDWGSVMIRYKGHKIDHASLLQYVVSHRTHTIFGEYCIEKIFMDITEQCSPEKLSVYGTYTRRGGIDICPFRSNFETEPPTLRLVRQ
jgi:7-cyano-7-deazaguanine reductase